jgi:hypothetical protein
MKQLIKAQEAGTVAVGVACSYKEDFVTNELQIHGGDDQTDL